MDLTHFARCAVRSGSHMDGNKWEAFQFRKNTALEARVEYLT